MTVAQPLHLSRLAVTGYTNPSRYRYYRHGGFYYKRAETREEVFRRQVANWLANGVVSDRQPARMVGPIPTLDGVHFRLVDGHGKTYGQRYRSMGRTMFGLTCRQVLVEDSRGNQIWLPGDTRCRAVDKQPEDYHSAACRALKAAHRSGQ